MYLQISLFLSSAANFVKGTVEITVCAVKTYVESLESKSNYPSDPPVGVKLGS